MGAIIGFFTGPLGKIAMYVIAALGIAAGLTVAIAHYENLVSEAAVMKREIAQYQQTIEDKDAYIKHTEAVVAFQGESIDILQKNVDATQEKYKTLEDYLNSKDAQASDRPSSEVLKNTIRKLKGLQQ